MAMYEAVIEKTVVNIAEKNGYFVRKVQWPGRSGAPDRVFIRGGRTIWIEFKDQGKVAEPHQIREHEKMRAAGAEVHVLDNVRRALAILEITVG